MVVRILLFPIYLMYLYINLFGHHSTLQIVNFQYIIYSILKAQNKPQKLFNNN